MASTIKVDKIEGSTGSTITVPTGQTFTITDGLAASTIGSGTLDVARLPTVTVAKGGTNLSSFTAGDLLYATGSTTLAKLPKGTAAQALVMNSGATAPEWGAAGGGAWNYISTTTISTATSWSITSGIDSTYDVYKILISGMQFNTDDRLFYLQFYVSGTLDTSTDYNWALNHSTSNGTTHVGGSGTDSIIKLNGDSNEGNADTRADCELTLWHPAESGYKCNVTYSFVNIGHSGDLKSTYGAGSKKTTGTIDGIRVHANNTGNFTGGTVRLYGISNS